MPKQTKPDFPSVAALHALPFVLAKKGQPVKFWHVPPVEDYTEACIIGYEFAADFLQYMKDFPSVSIPTLGHIAADTDFADESDAKGVWVGFFAGISSVLTMIAAIADPQREMARLIEQARNSERSDA